MEPGLVSTIIPVYNRPVLLRDAVASVLAQTYRPIEVIVVDDGSDPESRLAAERLAGEHRAEVALIVQEHSGVSAARNAGLQRVSGEFIQFLDSDDVLMPEKFARQVAGLSNDKAAGISYCYTREYVLGTTPPDVPTRKTARSFREMFPEMLHGRFWPTPAPLFRRSVTDAVGLFRDLAIYEDWEYECRAAAEGVRLHHCREFLADKRDVHAQEGRTKGGVPAGKFGDYLQVHELIFACALKAGVGPNDLDRFSRKLFRVARRSAADGFEDDARRALQLAIDASPRPSALRMYQSASRVCGWRTVGAPCEWVSRGVAQSAALMSHARESIPSPIRKPLGRVWRQGLAFGNHVRGWNVAREYSSHYQQARRVFERDGHRREPFAPALRDLGVQVVNPDTTPENLIDLPADYQVLVARVSAAVRAAFERSSGTRVVTSAAGNEVIALQLDAPLEIDGLAELSVPIVNELERRVFGSYVIVDKVYIYRSPVSCATPRASWVWHYDNHPREVLKVMIYLTDVTAGRAPFEYLREAHTGKPVAGAPIAPLHVRSRVDHSRVERWLRNGCETHTVIGPAGTMIVFDDNIIHRGTLARDGHRDALVFQVRPAAFRADPHLDKCWTGSFQHIDVNGDPNDITPRVKG